MQIAQRIKRLACRKGTSCSWNYESAERSRRHPSWCTVLRGRAVPFRRGTASLNLTISGSSSLRKSVCKIAVSPRSYLFVSVITRTTAFRTSCGLSVNTFEVWKTSDYSSLDDLQWTREWVWQSGPCRATDELFVVGINVTKWRNKICTSIMDLWLASQRPDVIATSRQHAPAEALTMSVLKVMLGPFPDNFQDSVVGGSAYEFCLIVIHVNCLRRSADIQRLTSSTHDFIVLVAEVILLLLQVGV